MSLKFEEGSKLIEVTFSILSDSNSYLNTQILNNITIFNGRREIIVINKSL